MKQSVLTVGVLGVLLWSGGALAQTGTGRAMPQWPPASSSAMLENPAPHSHQSGVSVISGWACEAEEIVIEIDERSFPAAYGTLREDTQEACGDTDNGFSLLWNWSNSGDGAHTVRALSDGVEFGTATVTVTTFGTPVLREASGSYILDDFPTTGEEIRIQWAESLQNFVIQGNPAAFTKDFVQAALNRYDRDGREATLAYYNDPASVEGEWYMFIIDENDLFVSHPAMPELIGRDVKTIVGSDGSELGKEIATATEDGHWIHYPWPHPTRSPHLNPCSPDPDLCPAPVGACEEEEAPKRSWVIRHDGLIFGSGYYEPADSCEFATFFVGIDMYAYSREPDYYSRVPDIAAVLENPTPQSFRSGVSAISGWACDAEEIVIEINRGRIPYAPVRGGAVGIKPKRKAIELTAAYGTVREDTAEVCGNTDNGFSLLWNWNTLGDGIHTVLAFIDGVPFARSSVTVTTFGEDMLGDEEKAAFTQDFVHAALDRYDSEGRAATVAYYNSPASIEKEWEGEWYVFIIDEHDRFLAHPVRPDLIGRDVKTLVDSNGYEFGKAIATATTGGGRIEFLHTLVPGSKYGVPGREVDARSRGDYVGAGHWIHYLWPNPAAGGVEEPKHTWAIRHDGLIFASGYYGPPNFQEYELADFPIEGSKPTVQWSQPLQNFVITDVRP